MLLRDAGDVLNIALVVAVSCDVLNYLLTSRCK